MKKVKYWIMTGAGLYLGAMAVLRWKQRRDRLRGILEKNAAQQEAEAPQETFLREWRAVFLKHARVYNGLYSGLQRIQSGTAKKPEKILREWCQRTHYKFEQQSVDLLCQEHIQPLIEAEDREELVQWAGMLLDAAAAAGIKAEKAATLVLTQENADAYIEWDGKELYPEDEIEVIMPAWYQNGNVLEQGQCRVLRTEEE